MSTDASLVAECEALLRAGQIRQVMRKLKSVNSSQIKRELRLPMANLCRRCGLWNLGLRLLAPLVRAKEHGLTEEATPAETVEYAVLLMKIGSVQEAMATISTAPAGSTAEIPLYRAFICMAQWEYAQAIDNLNAYLQQGPPQYTAMIARVNLAASLVWTERLAEAKEALDSLIHEAEDSKSMRLLANCLELRSQVYLHSNQLSACAEDLQTAARILGTEGSNDQLFIRKWQSVLASKKSGSLDPLLEFKNEAAARKHWESVRDCDFYILRNSFQPDLFAHLIRGTRHEPYRAKVCKILGQSRPAGRFLLGSRDTRSLDLGTGELQDGPSLNPGKGVHQLLHLLLQDFYRPMSLGLLFGDLFPSEYFDVHSSAARVHQIVSRTRRWLEENSIPVSICSANGAFKLQVDGAFCFLLSHDNEPVGGFHAQLLRLRQLSGGQFSCSEAGRHLHLSLPHARRILSWASSRGHLIRRGAGPMTRYQFSDVSPASLSEPLVNSQPAA